MVARGRPTTSQRGYGTEYQRIRAQWKTRVDAGTVRCWRCGKYLNPVVPWHLGHDDNDRRIIRGPECVPCNLGAAARKTNSIRRQKRGVPATPIRSRRW